MYVYKFVKNRDKLVNLSAKFLYSTLGLLPYLLFCSVAGLITYKALPRVVEFWRYSCAKKEYHFFSKLFALFNMKIAIFIVTR